jgi:hypothetical protein
MNSKREEVMKHITKMTDMGSPNNTSMQSTNGAHEKEGVKNREKKIAEKAFKGFDIVSKLTSTLYKEFIGAHVADIGK